VDIDLKEIENIALQAGRSIMDIYQKDFQVEYKDDNSPLTEADRLANKIICESLERLYPDIPILSEEGAEIDFETRGAWEYFWLIDPLDGTKEFVKRNGEFTVNIALIERGSPILGVVYAPVIERLYSAKKGEGAYLNGKRLPLKGEDRNFYVVASKSHLTSETKKFIDVLKEKFPDLELNSMGSSLKLCMVADGSADIYPRVAPTMEWDTAAAQVVVTEVGKGVYRYNPNVFPLDYLDSREKLEPLVYNKKSLRNPNFVVV